MKTVYKVTDCISLVQRRRYKVTARRSAWRHTRGKREIIAHFTDILEEINVSHFERSRYIL